MSLALKVLCRVMQRRLDRGEVFSRILQDYPLLTAAEREAVKGALHL